MSTQKRISKALAALLPGGALGASILLALTSPSVTEARSTQAEDPPSPANVSERLLAIRSAVSHLEASSQSSGSAELEFGGSERAEPTWWGNGGWGRWRFGWGNHGFGWPNWHNWGNGGWRNGGWNNGGWNNGGWHNYWHNY
jgi:rSAM-associated Gly-rich repeat protein